MCEAVSTRAARLAIIGIVALAKKINKIDGCTVAVDGSLYEKEKRPLFRERYCSISTYVYMTLYVWVDLMLNPLNFHTVSPEFFSQEAATLAFIKFLSCFK